MWSYFFSKSNFVSFIEFKTFSLRPISFSSISLFEGSISSKKIETWLWSTSSSMATIEPFSYSDFTGGNYSAWSFLPLPLPLSLSLLSYYGK